MRAVWGLAHALLTARDHDLGAAKLDLLGAEGDRAQARAAQLVHTPGGRVDRNAGQDGGLARWVLARAGGQDLAHNDLGYFTGFQARALEGTADRHLAQLVGRQARERAVEGTDRRSGGAGDDDSGLLSAHRMLQSVRVLQTAGVCVVSWLLNVGDMGRACSHDNRSRFAPATRGD